MPKSNSNKMSFDLDFENLETDKPLKQQVLDQMEDNGFSEEDLEDSEFNENMDEIYGPDEDEDEDDIVDNNEDEDNVEDEDDNSNDDSDATTDKKVVKNKDDTEDASDENKNKEFGDRANKRIRELNEKAKQRALEAEELRKQNFEIQKDNLSNKKDLLELKSERLASELEKALEDADYQKQAKLTSELSKVNFDLTEVTRKLDNDFKEYKPSKQEEEVNNDVFGVEFDQNKAGQLASDWEFNNPRVLADKVFYDTSIAIGKQLINRGIRPDTEKFYQELDKRMAAAFGYTTANTKEQKQDTGANNEVEKKKKNPPQKVQTVAGASRTPSPTSMNGVSSQRNTVRLSKEDIALARQNGWDLKQYAANRKRVEQATNEKGQIRVELFPDEL